MEKLSVGAVNKSLPDWVWNLNQNQCQILIQGMLLGDGHTMENGTCRYDTSSTQLADDFQKLCLHSGYSTNIALKRKKGEKLKIKNNETIRNYDTYHMSVLHQKQTLEPPVNTKAKSNKEELVSYTGKVHCCTVSSGVFYVRRNGVPIWTGNSSRYGQLADKCLFKKEASVLSMIICEISRCGNPLTALTTSYLMETLNIIQGNDLGYSKNVKDWEIRRVTT